MSSQDVVDSVGDVRMREIQASIAEGRMMLHVLKSLPSSENNDAFILRFEELVSRLESYRTQLCDSSRASEAVPMASTELASQCLPTTISSSPPQPVSSPPPNSVAKVENSLNGASSAAPNDASANVSLPSLQKAAHFSIELNRLTAFIEDAERFEGMVGRLIDITQRAHLTEATGFLCEIRTRFTELQRSFSSLRETCEAVRNDPLMSEELHDFQASSFSDFLSKLSTSLESTKECFFTIYHLVKSNIEQGMADGSLLEVGGDEENEATSEANGQTALTTCSTPENISAPVQAKADSSDAVIKDAASSTLEAQKIYLAALQSQTRAERDEIARLLKQRDELTGRLQSLQSAALVEQRCTNELENNHITNEHVSVTSSGPSATENSNISLLSAFGFNQSAVNNLEAKRKELEQLKAQLEALKKAEEKMAVLNVSASADGLHLGSVQSTGDVGVPLDLKTHEQNQPVLEPKVSIMTSLVHRLNTVMANEPTAVQTTAVATKPSIISNMLSGNLEASCRSTATPTERMNIDPAGGSKPSSECSPYLVGRTPLTASHDRTTFATWGGSSAAPSSANSFSIGATGEEESVDGAFQSSHGTGPGVLSDRSAFSSFDRSIGAYCERDQSTGPPTPRSVQQPAHSSSVLVSRHITVPQEHSTLSMPHVGTSPSPVVDRSLESQKADDSHHAAWRELGASHGQSGVDRAFTIGVNQKHTHSSDAGTFERVTQLENSVSQLYQICRYLVTENSQLNAAVKSLLLSLSRDVPTHNTSYPGNVYTAPPVGPASFVAQSSQPQLHSSQHRLPYPLCSSAETVCDAASIWQRLTPSEVDTKAPQLTQTHDSLLVLLSQLAQQQTHYYQLQTELQRLLLSRAQLTAGINHYVSSHLTAPDNQVTAALLSAISCVPTEAVHSGSYSSANLINPPSHGLASFGSSSAQFIPPAYPASTTVVPLPLVTRPLSAQSVAFSVPSTIPSSFSSYGHLTSLMHPLGNPVISPQPLSVESALSAAVDLLKKIQLPQNSTPGQSQA